MKGDDCLDGHRVKSANALCEPVADGKTLETGECTFVNIWKEKP